MHREIKKSRSLYIFLSGLFMSYVDAIIIAYGGETTSIYKTILPISQSIVDFLSDSAMISSLFLLLISTILAVSEKAYLNLRAEYRIWFYSVLVGFFLLLYYGIAVQDNDLRFVAKDMMAFLLLFGGILLGSDQKNWVIIDKFIVRLFSISVILSIISLYDLVKQVSNFTSRSDLTWSTPYILWGNLYIWPYFLLTANSGSKQRKIIAYSGVILFFLMAIYFQKRTPWINLGTMILLLLYSFLKQKGRMITFHNANKLLYSIFIAGILILLFQLTIGLREESLLSLSHRFISGGSLSETVSSDPRISRDVSLFLKYSDLETVFGRGIGADVGDVSEDPKYRIPHNGTIFMLIKGGVVFLPIWLAGWFLLLKDFFIKHNSSFNRYYIPVLVILLFSWVSAFMHNIFHFGFHMMCAGYAMSRFSVYRSKAFPSQFRKQQIYR